MHRFLSDAFEGNLLEALAIPVKVRYNKDENMNCGRPQGAPTPHGPVRVDLALSTAILDCTTRSL